MRFNVLLSIQQTHRFYSNQKILKYNFEFSLELGRRPQGSLWPFPAAGGEEEEEEEIVRGLFDCCLSVACLFCLVGEFWF